jgi:hypothetical protein
MDSMGSTQSLRRDLTQSNPADFAFSSLWISEIIEQKFQGQPYFFISAIAVTVSSIGVILSTR